MGLISWLKGIDEEDVRKNATIISGLMLQEKDYIGNISFLGMSNCLLRINYRGGHTWFVTVTVLALSCERHFYTFAPEGPVKSFLRDIASKYQDDPYYFEGERTQIFN